MMSKSEKYTVAQVAPKESVIALGDDFVKYIADDLIRELSKKVLERAEFSDVIVSLKPMRTAEITAWNQVEYRRNMIVTDVVRCKDCKYYWKNYTDDSIPVCLASPKDDAFCSEGERKDEFEEPEINPCRGCPDYDGRGGCISNGGCGERKDDVVD